MSEDKFVYNYTAPTEDERKEIEDIKRQFSPLESKEDKLTKLRRLNKRVNKPPKIFAYCFGVCALLIFGAGMALSLEGKQYIWGGIVAAVGLALMCVTRTIYKALLARRKKLYGQDILNLSNELLNKEDTE